MIVANLLREPSFQVAFVNCDDVIQEITPATRNSLHNAMSLISKSARVLANHRLKLSLHRGH
jgi:hypothetical protein